MPTGITLKDLAFLAVCLIPGFLSLKTAEALQPAPPRTDLERIALSSALGFAIFSLSLLLRRSMDAPADEPISTVLLSWLLIVPIGIVTSLLQSRSLLPRVMQALRLSRRAGGVSCWNAVLGGSAPVWVRVHLDNGTVCIGNVVLFSDLPPHELVINPVRMTGPTGRTEATYTAADRLYVRAEHVVCLETLSSDSGGES
jgi:hypothetical protein